MVRNLIAPLLAVLIGSSATADAEVVKTFQQLAPPLSFDHLSYLDGLPNSDVRTIIQDNRGFIWLGTQDGLARYDGTQMRVYRPIENDPSSLSGGYITALALDADGKLWVGTAENGVDLYDPDTDQFTRYTHGAKGSLTSEGVTAIARDAKGRMWFANSNGVGLDRFDPATNTFAEYLTGPLEAAMTAIAVDKSGSLWLGTASEGVIKWNPDDGSTIQLKPTPGDDHALDTSSTATILVASSGKVWIGTEGGGLAEVNPETMAIVRHHHAAADLGSLSDDHVTALFEDRHGDLWIGTFNGLDEMDKTGNLIAYHHDPQDATSLAFPQIESIYQDAGGVMWIGGFTSGVCKFDELRKKFGHYRTSTQPANSFFEDPDGTLWVGTYNGGLYKYDWKAQSVTVYTSFGTPGEAGALDLGSAWISALHRDARGVLWIALKGSGLIAFDTKAETYKLYAPDPDNTNSLPVDIIWDIWESDRGVLWLATWGGGLVRFDPVQGTFSAITTEQSVGLTENSLYTLYPDPTDKSILWIGTGHGGVVKFNISTGTGTSYRHKADDPSSLSNDDVLTIVRDATGVWVGTYGGGLNHLDPATGKWEKFTRDNSKLTNDVVLGILPDDAGKLWLSTNGGGLVQLDPKTKTFVAYDSTDGVQDNEFGQGAFMRTKSGELFFGGVGGFNAFMPKDITPNAYVPPIVMSGLKIFNEEIKLPRPIWTLPPIAVSYSDSFEVQFAALSFAAPTKNRYAYRLEGFDDKFIETDRPYATYTKLAGGHYTLRVRASNEHGTWNETGIALDIAVAPPIWRTWPAFAIYVVVLAAVGFLLFRMQQQKLRRVERESRLAVVERDLELTGAVQSGFLPEYNEVNEPHFQLYGFYRAADACSGDWWWHQSFGQRHIVMVGDVTGHGPGPAMVTAAIATAFQLLSASGNGLADVRQALELLNGVVLNVAKGKYHMTMAALELDEATGRWILHSAGAPPILTLDQKGKHKIEFCAGAPLGTEFEFEIGRLEGKLQSGERILIYTDGIPEITLPSGNVLGMRRFAQIYETTRPQNLATAAATIVHMADQTQQGKPQADDWTFTLVEWNA